VLEFQSQQMPNLSLTIGQIKITPLFWALALAFIFSSFSMWKKMIKESYLEKDIFSTQILILLGGVIFEILFKMSLGIIVFGAFLGILMVSAWRFKILAINFWEGLDWLVLPIIYFFFFGGIGLFLNSWQWTAFGYSATSLLGLGLYLYLKKHYRRFFWYKSGKTGFLFWSICFYFSAVLLVLDFLQTKKVYWSEVLWIVLLTSSAGAIYHRAELNKK